MTDFFLSLVNRSICASWLVLVVLLLRFILKKVPKRGNVLLWGVVALRLIWPFSIESAWSLLPSAETIPTNIALAASPAIDSGITAIDQAINPLLSASFTPNPTASANPLQIFLPLAAVLWLFGMLLLLLYAAGSYFRLRRSVASAVRQQSSVFLCETVASPFVLGIFLPKIYLPFHMDAQTQSHVLAHEQMHLRRKDHWWKPLGFLLLSVHWFNPLLWLAYILLCRDIELACDEQVIEHLDHEQRADYSQALLSCSIQSRRLAACPLAFGEVGVKERIKSVLHYKKPAVWLVLLAVVLCIFAAVCFLTDPVGFYFDEDQATLISASAYDVRLSGGSAELNHAQILELSSRLASIRASRRSNRYAGFTPQYQLTAQLQDGTYLYISGYSLSDKIMVDIAHGGTRYVISDSEFQNYLLRICTGQDTAAAESVSPYYLTIGAENVARIELSTPDASSGFSRADGSAFQKGERVLLDLPNEMPDLRGLTITAIDTDGKELWSASIPDTKENQGFTRLTIDGWTITNIS